MEPRRSARAPVPRDCYRSGQAPSEGRAVAASMGLGPPQGLGAPAAALESNRHAQEAGPTGMHGRAWGVDAAMDAALAVPLVCRVLVDSLTCAGDLRSLSLVAKRFSAIRGALLPHCDPPICK